MYFKYILVYFSLGYPYENMTFLQKKKKKDKSTALRFSKASWAKLIKMIYLGLKCFWETQPRTINARLAVLDYLFRLCFLQHTCPELIKAS